MGLLQLKIILSDTEIIRLITGSFWSAFHVLATANLVYVLMCFLMVGDRKGMCLPC